VRRFFDSRDEALEVMLKKMFEQTGGDGHPQVFVIGSTPAPNEGPNRLGVIFNELADFDYGLPSRIALAVCRSYPRQESFGLRDCLLCRHVFIWLTISVHQRPAHDRTAAVWCNAC
jgi:hypothetical protein